MQAVHRFLAILLADLRERTRSLRFWIVLTGVMVGSWACFPPPSAHYLTVSLVDGQRGAYSSAWIGMVLGMEFCTLLSLIGFYLVRGTLARDIDTRVWQLLVATPMTRGAYLLAKWASHMVIFGIIISVGLSVGLVAQWVRAEDTAFNLFELVKPVLVLSLPGLAITSMFAVWFDLVPWLRRTIGNVLFFIVWVTLTSTSLAQLDAPHANEVWTSDPNGMTVVARDFQRIREQQTGKPQEKGFSVGNQVIDHPPILFEWKAWHVRPMDALGRLLWLLGAMAGVLLAAPFLDWAAARGTAAAAKNVAGAGLRLAWLDKAMAPFARGLFGTLVIAELRLVLRQRRYGWWLLALVAWGVQAFSAEKGMVMAMMLAWLLPLDVFARGVLRERDTGTGGLMFTAAGITWRLLATRFAVAAILAVGLALPGMLRLLASHPEGALAAVAIAASISVWGLAVGAICRNPRPFELLLLGTVYVGIQGADIFDMSRDPATTALWHSLFLLPAAALLFWAWPRLARR